MLGFKIPEIDDMDDVNDLNIDNSNKKNKKLKEKNKSLEEVLAIPASIVLDCPSNNGLRPLHIAAFNNSLDAVKTLINSQVEINAKDNVGETALHKAARKSYFAIYNILVKEGHADEQILSINRQTPAQILKYDGV